jgi:N-glycosylase/DNA lyase
LIKCEREKDGIRLSGYSSFSLYNTLECGQTFRWNRTEDGWYVGIVGERFIKLKQDDDSIIISSPASDEGIQAVVEYFRLETDHGALEKSISGLDEHVCNAVEFGKGLRIVRQPLWECIVSFIISARNRVSFIKEEVELLCQRFGSRFCDQDHIFYTFPEPEVLASADVTEIQSCRVAYRAEYIKRTAELVASSKIPLDELFCMETSFTREQLMKLPGVGRKVADCVLLFALERFEVFPVDIWIQRVMQYFYFNSQPVRLREILEYAEENFREYAGYVQEYLYFYSRYDENLKKTLQAL